MAPCDHAEMVAALHVVQRVIRALAVETLVIAERGVADLERARAAVRDADQMARRYIKFAFDHFRSIRRVEAPERFVTGTAEPAQRVVRHVVPGDRKSTRLNSSH